jgi:hypothetical protein
MLNYALVNYRPITVAACKAVTVVSQFNPRVLKMLYSTLRFDIEKIDVRLAKFYNDEKPDPPGGDITFQFANYGRV